MDSDLSPDVYFTGADRAALLELLARVVSERVDVPVALGIPEPAPELTGTSALATAPITVLIGRRNGAL